MSDELRTRGHIPWSKVDRRLRAAREMWVASGGRGGRPDAVPVWFWWDGASVYFSTKATSRKARNIAVQPEVVIHNGDGADPVILKGPAVAVDRRDELDRVDDGYHEKYVDPHGGARATIFVEGDVVYRVRPRLVIAWEYATVGTRTDWELG
jgi:nitroimidazol reductase NimA-like FMN-containing flavoprotein (pyridoxamine 5'-phosphate oxidase superfamily)